MPLNTYRSWKHGGADVGCVFARFMARTPEKFDQREVLIPGKDSVRIAETIARRTTRYVNDPKVQAVAMVMPEVKKLQTLVKVAQELSSKQYWVVDRKLLRDTPVGDVVAFNLARHIPFGDTTCPSEALVLGPFRVFPKTRRAPVTALEVFVGTPPEKQPDGKPTVRAHLADIRIRLPKEDLFATMWAGSKKLRRVSLGGVEDDRAKAKVSFVIPVALATRMGCLP